VRPIASLDQLSPDEFADAIRPLFEAAAPLASALYEGRPYSSYAALVAAAESLAQRMSVDDQVAVLAAHPRIGANPASLSAHSAREQGSDEPRWVYQQLADLNATYEARFGFRFVVFVNKRPKSAIVEVLKDRLGNSREDELATGLRDMFVIARDRLCSLST
jgi:2-oxo-4-hydroxy-4-carboxy-5-ureidoimidazoline decarboxylase